MRHQLLALTLAAIATAGCKTTDKRAPADPPPAPAPTTAGDAAPAPAAAAIPAMRPPVCADRDACDKACAAGTEPACVRLGHLYRAGIGVDQDLTRAREVFAAACKRNHGRACVDLGEMSQKGVGADADPKKGLDYFDQGCAAGEGAGCRNAAIAHLAGIGVARDHDRASLEFGKARVAYDKACKAGDMRACAELGLLFEKGFGGQADLGGAAELYNQACTAGDPDGCQKLANVLLAGRAVPPDPTRALALLEATCEAGYGQGCNSLALQYMRGSDTVAVDYELAYQYFGMACDAGYAPGCGTRAELVMASKIDSAAPDSSLQGFERSCKLADSTGCYRLGQMMRAARTPENNERAVTYFARACAVGMARACSEQADLVGDEKRAAALKAKACELGLKTACAE